MWFRLGCVFMFAGVVMGAFGGHALKSSLTPDSLAVYEVGVRYLIYHALALFAVAWLAGRQPSAWTTVAGASFAIGIVLFSGSLSALALTGQRAWGMVTPLGGVLFLAGWASLFGAAVRSA